MEKMSLHTVDGGAKGPFERLQPGLAASFEGTKLRATLGALGCDLEQPSQVISCSYLRSPN